MKYTLPEFKKKEHTVRKNYVFIFDRLKHCKSAVDKLKKKEPLRNFRRQKGDMEQVPYSRPTNRCHHKNIYSPWRLGARNSSTP